MKTQIYNRIIQAMLLCVLAICMVLIPINIDIANAAGEIVYEDKIYCNSTINDDFDANKVLVLFDKAISGVNQNKSSYFAGLNVTATDITAITGNVSEKKYLNTSSFRQIYELTLPNDNKQQVLDIIETLEQVDGIKWVGTSAEELSSNISDLFYIPPAANDVLYELQWGLTADRGANLEAAWDITTGSQNVKVGVIDTGIKPHPDLNANLVAGYDFYNDNADANDDIHGHGTHVAGIIGATGQNTLAGASLNVSLVPLQVHATGNKLDDISVLKAIIWGINYNLDILNFSGGNRVDSPTLKAVLNNYMGLFVCAAGNGYQNENYLGQNNDNRPIYPSQYSKDSEIGSRVISVGAHDSNYQRSNFSNYSATAVSIFAPGGQYILSTGINNGNSSGLYGTSQATPFVTGVAALIKAKFPTLTPTQIKRRILNNVKEIEVSGVNIYENLCVSGGVLDAYRAVHNGLAHTEGYVLSSSNKCQKICKICNIVLDTTSHGGYTYKINGSSTHRRTCLCKEIVVDESHDIRITPTKRYCTGCNYVENLLGPPTEILPWGKDDDGECC